MQYQTTVEYKFDIHPLNPLTWFLYFTFFTTIPDDYGRSKEQNKLKPGTSLSKKYTGEISVHIGEKSTEPFQNGVFITFNLSR